MRLITRKTDYAVKALGHLARNVDSVVSVNELVRELSIPRPFLRAILQTLNKKKLVRSFKGKGGGFLLARSPEEILLVDIMEIFQGPLRLNECIFRKKLCPDRGSCSLKDKLDDIERDVVSELRTVTIASLL